MTQRKKRRRERCERRDEARRDKAERDREKEISLQGTPKGGRGRGKKGRSRVFARRRHFRKRDTGNRRSTFAYSRTEKSDDNGRDRPGGTIEIEIESELRIELNRRTTRRPTNVSGVGLPRRDIHLFRGPCFICLYLCNSLYRAIPLVICP